MEYPVAENKTTEYILTQESIEAFIHREAERNAHPRYISYCRCALRSLYEFLPEGKTLTKGALLSWRKQLEEKDLSQVTIQNYVKSLNCYLDDRGCSDLRFNRGRPKDIRGQTFGFLTAIEPTEKRYRKDVIWSCQCSCGNMVEVAATRLITGNTLSCGCIAKQHLDRANKNIEGTSIRQSLEEKVESARAESGYTGVVKKHGKWQAYIRYKGKYYSLGCYTLLQDAVRARAEAKKRVQDDAAALLEIYEELHKDDPALPNKTTMERQPVAPPPRERSSKTGAVRGDNTSGHAGVHLKRDKWQARITHKKVTYTLGSFESIEDAVRIRKTAEEKLGRSFLEFETFYHELKASETV